jgi:hypothetical protein
MSELEFLGGSVFVNGDTGEVTVTPYSIAEIKQLKELGILVVEIAKLAGVVLTEEEIAAL